MSALIRFCKWSLGVTAVTLATAMVFGIWATHRYDVSVRFLLERAAASAGVANPVLEQLLEPPHRNLDHVQVGAIRTDRPRIMLPGLRQWDGTGVPALMIERLALYRSLGYRPEQYPACGKHDVMSHVVCWLTTGKGSEAKKAVDLFLEQELRPAGVNSSDGESWEWALAFDLLHKFPELSPYEQEAIAEKLRTQLKSYLRILDGESASLWHKRSSLAAQAWLLAVAIHGQDEVDTLLARRAQAHFLDTIDALALTEAWPEGYNYWINNRALVIVLATSAWVNGLEQNRLSSTIKRAIHRAGLWSIYATRPDNRVEALGDEGPRVDLKDETRRVIDVIAQLTEDSVFATYSSYLQKLHGVQSYNRRFRSSFALFNDPRVPRLPGIRVGELAGLEAYLPNTELFGPEAINLFIARSGWGPDDTFITFRAGHTFTHHGHYDAGHFTIFKGRPLAVDSARYNGFFSPHRLYYGLRTVAKNSILVVRPGDAPRQHKKIEKDVNDGGQRLVIPTGSRIRDVSHWRHQLNSGGHYEGAELLEYDKGNGSYSYIRVDITPAYDSTRYDSQGKQGRIRSAVRELLYLHAEDRVVIRDIVIAVDPEYNKKWLLHSVNRPLVDRQRLLRGSPEAGIFESEGDSIVLINSPGRLDIKRILPDGAYLRVIGGEGYEFYVEGATVETSHPQTGENFGEGGDDRSWFDGGAWRFEIRPRFKRGRDEFLVALSPSLGIDRGGEVAALKSLQGPASGLSTPDKIVLFASPERGLEASFTLEGEQRELLLVGVAAGESYQLVSEDVIKDVEANSSGVIEMMLPLTVQPGDVLILRPKS